LDEKNKSEEKKTYYTTKIQKNITISKGKSTSESHGKKQNER